MLASRIATGAALIAALVAILLFDERFAPWYPMWLLAALALMIASAREVAGLMTASGAKPSSNVVVGGISALIAANWAPHLVSHFAHSSGHAVAFDASAATDAMAWPLWTFAAIVMAAFLDRASRFHAPGGAMASVAATVLTCAYVGLLGSFILQLRWLDGPGNGLPALGLLVAAAKGSDIGAYTIGRVAGRHKLCPLLSPNKTVEGAIGGLIAGILGAIGVVALTRALGVTTLSWPAAAGFGLVVGIAAQLGDLMESMMKRDGARKDASHTLPGFGGVLDVMDSLLFAGPVAYGYWLVFGP